MSTLRWATLASVFSIVSCGNGQLSNLLQGDTPSVGNILYQYDDHTSPAEETEQGYFRIYDRNRPIVAEPWEQIPIMLQLDARFNDEEISLITGAVDIWNQSTGLDLFAINFDDRALPPDPSLSLYDTLEDEIVGIYREDAWCRTGKPGTTLGTAIWEEDEESKRIAKADVLLNTWSYAFVDSLTSPSSAAMFPVDQDRYYTKMMVDLQSVLVHELGHVLGLDHIAGDFVGGDPVMNPFVFVGQGLAQRTPHPYEIELIRHLYQPTDYELPLRKDHLRSTGRNETRYPSDPEPNDDDDQDEGDDDQIEIEDPCGTKRRIDVYPYSKS